ncbi:MAG: AIR synthase-related protein, partial [Verrucomicrobiota bacterium]
GVGGNVRDVCCMGAKVVAVGDSLRFGDIELPKSKWIQEGVVAGIAGYGNPLGIPNVCGDVYFDPGYNDNCLVTVFTLGAIAEDEILHSFAPKEADGYHLILVGKPTDNSGFGGASFASGELDENEKEKNKGAVQEPNAFLERHLLKATYALHRILVERGAIDRVGFKDLGAGGIACASVELAEASGYGAEVEVEKVPVGMEGLPPHVILCSETQERFMWVVPDDLQELVLDHYNNTFALPEVSTGARAEVVGRIRNDGLYRVTWNDEVLVEAPAEEVTKGILYDREFVRPAARNSAEEIPPSSPDSFSADLLALLKHHNIASRKPIFESYDKQVQGAVQLEAGRGDAGVFRPFEDPIWPEEIRSAGAVVSLDQNPRYNRIDSGLGAKWAVYEALRNVCAVGGRPVAFTDCLCYGNPEKPDQMGDFVVGIEGVASAARSITLYDHPESGIPIVAGNVSLYNESQGRSIPPSPMIACVGRMPDASKAIGYGFTSDSSLVFHLGTLPQSLSGSLWLEIKGGKHGLIPDPKPTTVQKEAYAIVDMIEKEVILSCHDLSDGGLAVALAESAITGQRGFEGENFEKGSEAHVLFGEFGGFIVEVPAEKEATFAGMADALGIPVEFVGRTNNSDQFTLGSAISVPLSELSNAWNHGLRETLDS